MWVSGRFLDMLQTDLLSRLGTTTDVGNLGARNAALSAKIEALSAQKSKDDVTIDWLRLRVNDLEQKVSILLRETTHLSFPVPIMAPIAPVIPRAGESAPTWEDMGDDAALTAGIHHDDYGNLVFTRERES